MKLICTQENFKKAVFNSERVASKRNTLPILNNILFETEKGGLKLSATNLEIGISTKIGAKIEKEGKLTIPAKLIGSFCANLTGNGNIYLESTENNLKIKNDTNKTVIRGSSTDDYPLIPNKKNEYLLELETIKIRNILSKIIPAVAINEARQELTGINIKLTEKELVFASTDSFRLAQYKLDINEKNTNAEIYKIFIQKNENIIIPLNTLLELNRVIQTDQDEMVKITIEESQIFFEINGIKLVSRLINGKYPNYEHIMPKEYVTRVVGEKQALQTAIKMASIFSAKGSGEITLKIDSETKKVTILSSSAEAGENSTELNFDVVGPSQEVIFNSKYLLDGINASSSEKVAVLFNSASTPAAVKETHEKTGKILDNFTYIVMPIKN